MDHTKKTTRIVPLLLALLLLFCAVPALAEGDDAQATPENAPETSFLAAPQSDDALEYLNDGWAALSENAQEELPAAFDLRKSGRVSAVRDQNPFGTCWTFAVMGAMESNLRTQGVTNVDLAEAHLAFFCGSSLYRLESMETYLEDEKNTDAFTLFRNPAARLTFGFTEGGNDDIAVGALSSWVGPISEEKMPYSEVGEICGDETDNETFQKGAELLVEKWDREPTLEYGAEYHLQDALYFGKGMLTGDDSAARERRSTVKCLLQEYGALSIGYNSYGDDLYVNNRTVTTQNHAVLLVGWDDDFSREKFPEYCRPNGDGAWLVRNNYGTDWGDAGYFWISYEDTSLSMEPAYLMESSDNYDHIYQFDRLGWKSSLAAELNDGAASGEAYMANIFTAENAETGEMLEAVSFYTTDVNTEYTISIYTGVEAGWPTIGVLQTSLSGTQTYPGYHTVRLKEPVELMNGERFSVVIRLRNQSGGYAYPIAVESARSEERPYLLGMDSGTGFVSAVAADGTPAGWYEVVEAQNEQGVWPTAVCIKAFTSDWHGGVHASSLSDTVKEDTVVTLHAAGADAIQYTLNGGETQTLDGSSGDVTLRFGAEKTVTLLAWAVYGDVTSEESGWIYRKASVDVVDVYGAADTPKRYTAEKKIREDGRATYIVTLPAGADKAKFQVCGGDSVRYGAAGLPAGEWSDEMRLEAGTDEDGQPDGTHTLSLAVTACKDGYNDTEFEVFFYSPAPLEYAAFDCLNETMTVRAGYLLQYPGDDPEKPVDFESDVAINAENKPVLNDAVFDANTDPVFSADQLAGESLTVYRYRETVDGFHEWDPVEDENGEAVTVTVPSRRNLPVLKPDYAAWDGGENGVSVSSNLSGDQYDLRWSRTEDGCTMAGQYSYFFKNPPSVKPGDVLYLYLPATGEEFASPIARLQLPAVPGEVRVTVEEEAAGDSVTLYLDLPEITEEEWPWPTEETIVPNYEVEYSIDNGENWYSAMLFTEDGQKSIIVTDLEPTQKYTVLVRVAALIGDTDSATHLQTGRWPGGVTSVRVTAGEGYRLPYYLTYHGFRVEELTQYFLLTEGETVTVEPDWKALAEERYVCPAGQTPDAVEVTLEDGVPTIDEMSCEITYLTGRMPEEMTYKVSYYDETGSWLEDLRFTFLTSGEVTYGTLPTPDGTVLDERFNAADKVATRLVIDERGRMYAATPWVRCRVRRGTSQTWDSVAFQGRGQTLYNSNLTSGMRSAGHSSVSDVAQAMSAALQTRMGGAVDVENLRVYEGIAQCVLNGKVCVDLQDLPDDAGEVVVTLRLKDAEGKPLKVNWDEYTPIVTHMYAKDENGHKAGDVEFLEVLPCSGVSNVVRVRTNSLSPLAVTWTTEQLQPDVKVQSGLSDGDLPAGMSRQQVETALQNALTGRLQLTGCALYSVSMINGEPSGPVTVKLPLPEGVDARLQTVVVAHMRTRDTPDGAAGSVELPEVTVLSDREVQVTVNSLSPFAVGWGEAPRSEHPEIGEAIRNGTWGTPDMPAQTADAAGGIPRTSDDSSLLLWMILLGLSAAGTAVLYRRKR